MAALQLLARKNNLIVWTGERLQEPEAFFPYPKGRLFIIFGKRK